MGRGSLAKTRWKNDRIKKKKMRLKKQADARHDQRLEQPAK